MAGIARAKGHSHVETLHFLVSLDSFLDPFVQPYISVAATGLALAA